MRVCFVENFGRSTVIDKTLQGSIVVPSLLATRKEFTIGECSRATLAKGVVRVGIDALIALNLGDILASLHNLLASLEEDRLVAQLDESQRTIQSCRASAHDDNLGLTYHRGVVEVERLGLLLVVDVCFECKIDLQCSAPCVDRALGNTQ